MKIIKRILLGVLILFLVAVAGGIGTMILATSTLSTQHANEDTILPNSENTENKALVIYQPSMSDNTKNIATSIAKAINAKGYAVTINHPSDSLGTDLSKYRIVVFGTPYYAGRTSSVLDTYIKKVSGLQSAHVLFFETGAASQTAKDTEEMKTKVPVAAASAVTVKFGSDKAENDKLIEQTVNNLCK